MTKRKKNIIPVLIVAMLAFAMACKTDLPPEEIDLRPPELQLDILDNPPAPFPADGARNISPSFGSLVFRISIDPNSAVTWDLFAGTSPTELSYVGRFVDGEYDYSIAANQPSLYKALGVENTTILKSNTTYYWFARNSTDHKRTSVWSFTTYANGIDQTNGIGPVTFDNISGAAALSSLYGLTYTAGGSIDNLVGQPFPSLTLTSGSALSPSYAYCNQYTDAYVDFNLRIGQSALYNFETHNLYNTATGTYGGNASAIALTTNTLTTIRRLLPYGEVLQYVTANSGVQGRYLDRLYRITVAPGSMSYNNTVLNGVYTSNPTDVDFLYPATSTATTDVTAGAAEATDIYSAVAGSTNTNNLSVPETLKVLGGTGGFLRFDVGVATYTWRSVTDGTAAPGAAGTVPTALDAYDITILRTCYT